MIISDSTDKLFAALSKFQANLEPAQKDKQGHGYMYTDLAGCMAVARDGLAENGLSVLQFIGMTDVENTLITVVTHSSGQYIGSEFVMEKAVLHGGASSNPAQKMGASITYMRRYAYAAILGIAQEDNDAAGSSPAKKNKPAARKSAPRSAPPAASKSNVPDKLSAAQKNRLMVAYSGVADDVRKAHASKVVGREITSFNDLTKSEASTIIDRAVKAEQGKNEHS